VKLAQAQPKPPDVIKPKVVRTETIATPQSGSAPARPVGIFEPKRVAPPVQPAAIVKPEPAAPKPAVPEPAAKFELASVPMPPSRPEFEPPPKRQVQPARRSARVHERIDKKSIAEAKAKHETKAGVETKPDPVGAVSSFLKKLVTPDKTTRKQSVEADADPPSHVQPPQ
jgi:hypothetical protein